MRNVSRLAVLLLAAFVADASAAVVAVTGCVFDDANANGTREESEGGLAGIVVSDGETVLRTSSAGEFGFDIEVAETRFVFIVPPSGRKPTTSSAVRLDVEDAPTARVVDFGLTDDAASGQSDFTFLVTADSQFTSQAEADLLREEFAQITSVACAPAFFFNVGDLTMSGTVAQFDLYRFALEPFTIPVYPVFGGHDGVYARDDTRAGSTANYEAQLNAPPYYAWEYGGVHFVTFVSEGGYLSGAAAGRQAKWLEGYFGAIPAGSRVVTVSHTPPSAQQLDAWSERHTVLAHFYGHWHGDGVSRRRDIPLMRTGPMRGLDWGAFSRTIRVCRFAGGKLSCEVRPTGQYKRIEVVSPAEGQAVGQGVVPIQVLAYDTAAWVTDVTCVILGGGIEETLPMTQRAEWTWYAAWDAQGSGGGPYGLEATARLNTGETCHTSIQFQLTEEAPPVVRLGADWPFALQDFADGRRTSEELSPPLKLAWVAHTRGSNVIGASPIVTRGRVFVGVETENWPNDAAGVACYDARTGKRLWHAATNGSIAGSPAYWEGRIFALSALGTAYCFDAATGGPVWRRDLYPPDATHRACRAPVVVWQGRVCVMIDFTPLVILDADTGAEIRRISVENDRYASGPTVAGGVVYTTAQRDVTARHLDSGAQVWKTAVGRARAVSGPVVFEGVVYHNGPVARALDGKSGELLWEQAVESGSRAVGVPVVDENRVYVGGRVITALNRGTGKPVWRFAVGQDERRFANNRRQSLGGGSSPVLAGNLLYFGGDDGYLYALERDTGAVHWRYWLAVPIKTSPAVSGNALFVMDYDGNLYAFGVTRGDGR